MEASLNKTPAPITPDKETFCAFPKKLSSFKLIEPKAPNPVSKPPPNPTLFVDFSLTTIATSYVPGFSSLGFISLSTSSKI